MDVYQCCICGEIFYGWGNNPWPVNEDPNEKCCDWCNLSKVVPARIANSLAKKPSKGDK
jgi:hypothetical protein